MLPCHLCRILLAAALSLVMSSPLISVVMAVHNGMPYLPQAVDSILQQTFKNFEFLIVDDGSTDNTAELLRGYQLRDSRVQVISQANRGLTVSLNRMLTVAQGKYIARMDSDDIAHPERLEIQWQQMEANPDVVCCGTWAVEVDEQGRPFSHWAPPLSHEKIDELHLSCVGGGIIHPTAMLRRSSLSQIGGYDSRWSVAQDYALWLRLAEVGRLCNLPRLLLQYRRRRQSISWARGREQHDTVIAIHADALKRRGIVNRGDRPECYDMDIQSERWMAETAATYGYFKTAVYYACRASWGNPWRVRPWRLWAKLARTISRQSLGVPMITAESKRCTG